MLETLAAGQKSLRAIETDEGGSGIGRKAFGTLWNGPISAPEVLRPIQNWVQDGVRGGIHVGFRQLVGQAKSSEDCQNFVRQISSDLKPALAEIQAVFQELQLDACQAFGSEDIRSISLVEIKQRLEAWINQPQALEIWVGYRFRWDRLLADGTRQLAEHIAQGRLGADEAVDHFYMAYYEELMRLVYRDCHTEAKSDKRPAGDGLQQAKEYAEILGLKFAYATNGTEIIEYDYFTCQEQVIDRFPTPDELWTRYQHRR